MEPILNIENLTKTYGTIHRRGFQFMIGQIVSNSIKYSMEEPHELNLHMIQ